MDTNLVKDGSEREESELLAELRSALNKSKASEAELRAIVERQQLAVEAAEVGTWSWDLIHDVLTLSARCRTFFGIGPDDQVSYGIFLDRLHPDDRERTNFAVHAAIAGRNTYDIQFRSLWPDGSVHWVRAKGRAKYDGSGSAIWFEGIVIDITEQKNAEFALRESEQRFRSLVQATAAVVWTTPRNGEFEEPQWEWSAYTGQAAEELKGWNWLAAVHPDDRERTAQAWQRAVDTLRPYQIEHRLRRHDGVYRWMQARAVPVLNEDGSLREWIGIHDEIQEQREAAEQLVMAKSEADFANEAKSEFLASMSHELRTPLNAIIGYSEMLQEEAEDSNAAHLIPDLQRVNTAGKHLLALINDVLDLSKIEAGKMEIHAQDFAVDQMLNDVVSTARPLMAKNRNELKLHVTGGLGSMHADLTKVRQILLNLLSNAAKFTQAGTVRLEAKQIHHGGRTMLELTVSDNGIGIAPEQLAKLFTPFTQVNKETSQQTGGTGLGLALSRRFAQLMGGDITVESELGSGSRFIVSLPQHQGQTHEEHPEAKLTRESLPANSQIDVLVIDDDANTRDLLVRSLSRDGIVAAAAATGEEGVRLAEELRPKLITLDVLMPGVDGWRVLATLKAHPDLSVIPVAVITMLDQKELAYVLGAADYLVKPVSRMQLERLLDRYEVVTRQSKALLVDDDADMRRLLRQMLEREGWKVEEAEDGLAGIEQVRRFRPDLVLLDLVMPRMDGLAFAHELSMHPEWGPIPVVLLTSKDLTSEDRQELNGYVTRVVEKGACTRETLIRELRRLIERKKGAAG